MDTKKVREDLARAFKAAGNADKAVLATAIQLCEERLQQIELEQEGKLAIVPTEPGSDLIESMCLRENHGFHAPTQTLTVGNDTVEMGLTEAQRNAARTTMRQLHEEVVGTGFYHQDKDWWKAAPKP